MSKVNLITASNVSEKIKPVHIKKPISTFVRVANIVAIVVPFIALIAGSVMMYHLGYSWVELSLLSSMYILTVLGITVGFHRLFTHRSFETGKVVQCIFAILGSMAAQGPLLKWVATHRCHHQYSDMHEDPHSPRVFGNSRFGRIQAFYHSHIGWFFEPDPVNLSNYVKDLSRSKLLCTISDLFPLWVALGLIIPAAIGGAITGTWFGALLGFVWGGLVRMLLVHHVTWSINSICHIWGGRTYKTTDDSRNNALFGLLALGEGWHNNHHAFQTSARHGLKWWQVDISYIVIWALAKAKLVWNVRLPVAG